MVPTSSFLYHVSKKETRQCNHERNIIFFFCEQTWSHINTFCGLDRITESLAAALNYLKDSPLAFGLLLVSCSAVPFCSEWHKRKACGCRTPLNSRRILIFYRVLVTTTKFHLFCVCILILILKFTLINIRMSQELGKNKRMNMTEVRNAFLNNFKYLNSKLYNF